MSTTGPAELTLDDGIRALLVLMPRLVGRAKRIPPPANLSALAPRHLSLLSHLLFDGALTVNELATRLEIAPTTVSLMVSDLTRQGVLERREDEQDRRRRIITITESRKPEISAWLARGAQAWRAALEPLSPAERALFVRTLLAYESGMTEDQQVT